MKRIAAAALAAFVAWQAPVWWKRFRCFRRGHHNPIRHLLGGFRCVDCRKPGRDMDALGHDGTLSGMRSFSRDNGGEFVRSGVWREGRG